MNIIYVDDDTLNHIKFEKESEIIAQIGSKLYFTDAQSALAHCEQQKPDLAFVDIMIPEKNGIWFAAKLNRLNIPFAFLTDYNNWATEAFSLNAVNYLIKPIRSSDIELTLAKLSQRNSLNIFQTLDRKLPTLFSKSLSKKDHPEIIVVKNHGMIHILRLKEIMYFEASGAYTNIYCNGDNTYKSSKLLKSFANNLKDHPEFIRIHRSFLVNRNYITGINTSIQNLSVILTSKTELKIAPDMKDKILEYIAK